ncbi:MAG: sulfate transporter CysZ [Gammaproteobacteria bacterium]
MSNSFFSGAKYAFSGFKLISKPRIRKYVAIPFLINLVLFSFALWFGSNWIDSMIESWLPGWLMWLEYLIWPILAIMSLVVIFSTFTLIANLVGAPFNSMLAQAVETRLSGEELINNPKLSSIAKDALVSINSEIGKLIFFVLRAIPIMIISFIPGINFIAPFLWFLFAAWMLVHEYMDYPMGNNGYLFKQQRPVLRKKRFTILGFGAMVTLMTMTPIVNFFAMPVAVAGATNMWFQEFKQISTN